MNYERSYQNKFDGSVVYSEPGIQSITVISSLKTLPSKLLAFKDTLPISAMLDRSSISQMLNYAL